MKLSRITALALAALAAAPALAQEAAPAATAARTPMETAILAVAGLIACGVAGRKRQVGNVVMASGIVVFVAFVALGAWAIVDFNGFFRMFHQLFFSQGNWEFPYDSLLICALPTEFWMGMGVVWLAVSFAVSILSIIIGRRLKK